MTLSWCFYAPRWICRLPVDLSGSLTATLRYSDVQGRQSRLANHVAGAAIRMVCFMLSLTVTLTLWCCSVPVSVACVWCRPLAAHVKAGTPRGRVANATPDHSQKDHTILTSQSLGCFPQVLGLGMDDAWVHFIVWVNQLSYFSLQSNQDASANIQLQPLDCQLSLIFAA